MANKNKFTFVKSKDNYQDDFGIQTREYYSIFHLREKIGRFELNYQYDDDILWLYNISVIPKMQNQGAGTATINFCTDRVAQLVKTKIKCVVKPLGGNSTKGLLKWYKNRGFTISKQNGRDIAEKIVEST